MTQSIKRLKTEKFFDGYLQFYKYDFEIPSFSSAQQTLVMKNREVIHSRNSVLVLIYAAQHDCFILGKEFRPGVFCNEANQDDPFILECVAGAIEPGTTPEETALRETYEETGLRITEAHLIATAYKSPGILTEKTYIYYAEFHGELKEGIYGLKEEHEEILTQWLPSTEVYALMDAMKIIDAATLIALHWFRAHKMTSR